MSGDIELKSIKPDRVFDGGDLDCGSGLVLMLRENILQVPENGILEMRSSDPSVSEDLPPWCRMSGHRYLGKIKADGYTRYFLVRTSITPDQEKKLMSDLQKAKDYEWRARTRSTGNLKSTVYCRNFSFDVGQPASFGENDVHPSAVEYLIGALSASLSTAFTTECARASLEVDDVEITVRCKLANVLASMGIELGDPGISVIELKCFVSTLEDEVKVRLLWDKTVMQSPIVATLVKSVDLKIAMSIV